ncbi:MAG TPA: hypothetical protein VFB80_24330, partial [Pirellulaceae bacterium]|nr:hypothetical protein [Pirellulaceae bacterium]
MALSIGLGWLGSWLARVRHQRQIVARIKEAGGRVRYEHELNWVNVGRNATHYEPKPPPGHWLVHRVVGEDALANVGEVTFDFRNPATDADLAQLDELPRLKWLRIQGQGVSDASMATIA